MHTYSEPHVAFINFIDVNMMMIIIICMQKSFVRAFGYIEISKSNVQIV